MLLFQVNYAPNRWSEGSPHADLTGNPTALSQPLAAFRRPTSKIRMEGEGKGREDKERAKEEGKGGKERGEERKKGNGARGVRPAHALIRYFRRI